MTSVTLTLRSYEFWLAQYRRVWRGSIGFSVLNPVFYLGALGIGLGTLVNRSASTPGGVAYLDYVAPGMLAATAMQVATAEATWPVMGAIKWARNYIAMLATPLGIREILAGHQLWMATRVALSSGIYLVVIAAFGAVHSPLGALAFPVCLLLGVSVSAPVAAFSATVKSDGAFPPLFRFVVIPMFLFSGTFFPVSRLPAALQPVAYATPLWHGVDLCRGLTLGTIHWLAALGHVAYLMAWAVAGLVLAERAYRKRLLR